jgi:hypothetical protein
MQQDSDHPSRNPHNSLCDRQFTQRHVQSVMTAVKLEDARRVISAAETKASEIGAAAF